MRLDADLLRYLTKVQWRVLEAVELGLKNHELVPVELIGRIANLRRTGITNVLSDLLKHKLIAHNRQIYDGYKLTYLGYDFLALRAFVARGHLDGVGMRMGVGKESDIHICQGTNGRRIILKLHRLGRVSFRSIKRHRDYLGNRQSASWMYLARLAAAKEFAYMKALYEHGFPVPEPIDLNRHGILMSYVDGYPLSQVRELQHPLQILERLMQLIVKLAESGLIHGDFNEFNLMISETEKITMIDFPQIVSTNHPNAEVYFNRDVECIKTLFKCKFGINVTEYPRFSEMNIPDSNATGTTLFREGIPGVDEQKLQDALKVRELQQKSIRNLTEGPSSNEDDESDKDEAILDVYDLEGFVEVQDMNNDTAQSTKKESREKDNVETTKDLESCEDSSSSSNTHEESMSNSEDELSSNDDIKEGPRKRLDNVWRPTVKRKTAEGARKHVVAADKKKKRYRKGNGGEKRSREGRKIREALHCDW